MTTKRELVEALEAKAQAKRFDQLAGFRPYKRQLEFVAYGGKFRERALFAANQTGKTSVICAEVAAHVTGFYPDWWPSDAKRFEYPTEWIISGKTAQSTRDILQKKLIGAAGSEANIGTGMIPKKCIVMESKVASHSARRCNRHH